MSPTLPSLLIVDPASTTADYAGVLRPSFSVSVTPRIAAAQQFIQRNPPAFVITEWQLEDGVGEEMCRIAKAMATPASVLVTTSDPQAAPAALDAGCDSMLLKPFAPNLLSARLGRMLRVRAKSAQLRDRSSTLLQRVVAERAKVDHMIDRKEMRKAGAIVEWPSSSCPYCSCAGVFSFEHSSMRRDWFTCMQCRKVWLAKRLE